MYNYTYINFLIHHRDYLQDGLIVNVSVTSSSSLLLVLSSGGRKIDIELNKLPANDNREELKSLVFKLFDRITLLEEDLKGICTCTLLKIALYFLLRYK